MTGITVVYIMMDTCRGNDGNYKNQCNAACGCGDGMSCSMFGMQCLNEPRQNNEECSGAKCMNGTKCIPWFQRCSDGLCGSLCNHDGDCHSELRCQYIDREPNVLGGRVCVARNVDGDVTDRLYGCIDQPHLNPVVSINPQNINSTRYSVYDKFPDCRGAVVQQGCCGSCVAFTVGVELGVQQCMMDQRFGVRNSTHWKAAVTESILDYYSHITKLRGPRFVRLSEQYLLSCSLEYARDNLVSRGLSPDHDTCEGFWNHEEHNTVNIYGVAPYEDLAYEEGDTYWLTSACIEDGVTTPCLNGTTENRVMIGCHSMMYRSFEEVKWHIVHVGPVAINVHANNVGLLDSSTSKWYSHDLLVGSNAQTNHAVMAYGFGTDDPSGLPYLLIHNSWGASWGHFGTAKVSYSSVKIVAGCIPTELVAKYNLEFDGMFLRNATGLIQAAEAGGYD